MLLVESEMRKVSDMERFMNEQKLKMLLKFEKIKILEEFYNIHNGDRQICLEFEVSE